MIFMGTELTDEEVKRIAEVGGIGLAVTAGLISGRLISDAFTKRGYTDDQYKEIQEIAIKSAQDLADLNAKLNSMQNPVGRIPLGGEGNRGGGYNY